MKRNLQFGTAMKPGNTPGTATSIIIDRLGYRSALIGLAVAEVTESSSVVAKIQHGDAADGSDMVDFTPDDTVISTSILSASNTNTYLDVDLSGAKRYIQLAFTTAGTAPTFSSYITLGDVDYGDGFDE